MLEIWNFIELPIGNGAYDRDAMKPFILEFLENLGVILACKPFDEWPSEAKVAFNHTQRKIPVGAEIYRNNLPMKE